REKNGIDIKDEDGGNPLDARDIIDPMVYLLSLYLCRANFLIEATLLDTGNLKANNIYVGRGYNGGQGAFGIGKKKAAAICFHEDHVNVLAPDENLALHYNFIYATRRNISHVGLYIYIAPCT
ncbi:hypothetical protein ACJX0J_019249, partial [Zea mays]